MENKIIDLKHSISTVDNELNDLNKLIINSKDSNTKDQVLEMIKGLKSYRLGLTHALEIMEGE